jgi:hypothetical protein
MARAELRAALEGTLLMNLQNPDYFVSPAGLKVTYDRTRAMFDSSNPAGLGWITYMATVSGSGVETPFYDVSLSAAGWLSAGGPSEMVPVVATYQLGAFAASLGIVPRNPNTGAPVTDLSSLIVRYPAVPPATTGSAVKDHQALASYVAQVCAGNSTNPGFLPSRYDATTTEGHLPRRMVCVGADCPP